MRNSQEGGAAVKALRDKRDDMKSHTKEIYVANLVHLKR